MAKPDLIELSTDWNTALVVADRYSGLGGGSEADRYFTEQGKRVLAAVLLIANKRGEDYRWVDEAFRDDQLMSEIIQGDNQPATASAIWVLQSLFWGDERQRADIFSLPTSCLRRPSSPTHTLIPASTTEPQS